MTNRRGCERCETELPGDAPEGLCPSCLLAAGVATASYDGVDDELAGGFVLSAGARIGDYDLIEPIASGGMGVVYRARQRRLDRIVALKMCRAGAFASADELARFRIEALAIARLDHPNIVPIYEVGEHRDGPYFSMRLVEGGSLAAQVDRFRGEPRAAGALIATLARAVHHAHLRGILHRDLKPGNVLLDEQGTPCLTDFGLARQIGADSSLTRSGQILGSASYMAPEQTLGDPARQTTAVDVYGLGAILYELLSGAPPFAGATVLDTLDLVRREEPPPIGNPLVDRDLATICATCLKKEPEARYASANALAHDLDHWLADEPIRARRSGAFERAWRWSRRKPMMALIGAVAGLAFLAGVLTGRCQPRQSKVQSEGSEEGSRRVERDLAQEVSITEREMKMAERGTMLDTDKTSIRLGGRRAGRRWLALLALLGTACASTTTTSPMQSPGPNQPPAPHTTPAGVALDRSMDAYVHDDFGTARRLAEQVLSMQPDAAVERKAWRIIAASSCNLEDGARAWTTFHMHIADPTDQRFVKWVCKRKGIDFEANLAR